MSLSPFGPPIGPMSMLIAVVVASFIVVEFLNSLDKREQAKTAAAKAAEIKAKGEEGEAKAKALLQRKGYRIKEEQAVRVGYIWVDGVRRKYTIRLDFVVSKWFREYIVEAKSEDADPATASEARRQMMDYYLALKPRNVLLAVDATRSKIYRVDINRMHRRGRFSLTVVLALAVGVGVFIDSASDFCESYARLIQLRSDEPSASLVLTALDYLMRQQCGY